jgi:hypothetical protein
MKNQNQKALNYLKAYWKHKSSETADNFSFYRVSSILVKILSKKTDLIICDSPYHLLRRVGSFDSHYTSWQGVNSINIKGLPLFLKRQFGKNSTMRVLSCIRGGIFNKF